MRRGSKLFLYLTGRRDAGVVSSRGDVSWPQPISDLVCVRLGVDVNDAGARYGGYVLGQPRQPRCLVRYRDVVEIERLAEQWSSLDLPVSAELLSDVVSDLLRRRRCCTQHRSTCIINSPSSSSSVPLCCNTALKRCTTTEKFSETGNKPHEGRVMLPKFVYQDRSTKDARLRSVGPEFHIKIGSTWYKNKKKT